MVSLDQNRNAIGQLTYEKCYMDLYNFIQNFKLNIWISTPNVSDLFISMGSLLINYKDIHEML